MTKPLFSICLITRNEAKTLPRLLASLQNFRKSGGEICIVDTGSTDDTVSIAKSAGCIVKEMGDTFRHKIDNYKEINERFVVSGEKDIVTKDDTYFDFSSARNAAAGMASNDFIFWYDADEVSVAMDINYINSEIQKGATRFNYHFVFAYDQWNNEVVKFIQCKAYDKRHNEWRGIVHELVTATNDTNKEVHLPENIYKLGHYQNHETGRHSYLIGLAVDCYNHPEADRQSHYAAREFMWSGRLRSAIKEFERHVAMNRWQAEKAQSLIHIGDCYGSLNQMEKQLEYYSKAIITDGSRRQAFIKTAVTYLHNKKYHLAISYAKAALEIPFSNFYANNMGDYTHTPHEILYNAYGWTGDIEMAKEHLLKALSYQPYNKAYLRDTKFYCEYPSSTIDGWMRYNEECWLYNEAKKHQLIVEVGSWKGRSTTALCKGAKGSVIAVDTWKGSDEVSDLTHGKDVYDEFKKNMAEFDNLDTLRMKSVEAAATFEDNTIDFLFIDASHDYDNVKADIQAWLPKVRGVISGHDYSDTWPGVKRAVDELFPKVTVTDSIWSVELNKAAPVLHGPNSIPKKIFTAWFGSDIPDDLQKCIDSQKIAGYEHFNFKAIRDIDSKFVKLVMTMEDSPAKWTKLSDYIRLYVLYQYGGIWLDADVEVKSNFDSLLNNEMFLGIEQTTERGIVIGNAVIGSVAGHPFLKHLMDEMDSRVWDSSPYMSGMDLLNVEGVKFQDRFTLVGPELFYTPSDKNIALHHFNNSWVKKPTLSIIIPQLGREEGLKKCYKSIKNLNYPQALIEVIIVEGEDTVPLKVAKGYADSTGEWIVYAANDMTFDKECINAALKLHATTGKRMLSFNEGELLPDRGNIATHFMIHRSLVEQLGGVIFDTDFTHAGVDNLLWKRCEAMGEAAWCRDALITHNHFSKGFPMDPIYEKGWANVDKDRALLQQKVVENCLP